MENKLNKLNREDWVVLNGKYEVVFMGAKTIQGFSDNFKIWFFEDDSGRLYELSESFGRFTFDRYGKNGSAQAPDAIIVEELETLRKIGQDVGK